MFHSTLIPRSNRTWFPPRFWIAPTVLLLPLVAGIVAANMHLGDPVELIGWPILFAIVPGALISYVVGRIYGATYGWWSFVSVGLAAAYLIYLWTNPVLPFPV